MKILKILSIIFLLTITSKLCVAGQRETIDLPSCTLSFTKASNQADPRLPTLVLLNGIPESSSIYDFLVEELIKRGVPNPIIQLDLPATGKSRLKTAVNWSDQRQCMSEYLNSMGPVIPVIHDVSGPVVIPLLKGNSRIPAFILFDTIVRPSQFHPKFPMSVARLHYVGALSVELTPFWFFSWRYKLEGFGRPDAVSDAFLYKIYSGISGKDLHANLAGFELNTWTDRIILDGLTEARPRLVIWGEQDRMIGQQFSFLPEKDRSQAVVLQGAKHFLMVDYAKEISFVMAAWLKQYGWFSPQP